ncbi:putative Ig domain-containing protein [aff. Roholtiella sp. LEGE 12411]|uniref:putative Ig domain-containing protein n=1 Tax=aff. Roholtiella sp. LEGE 12411 TaxID=1828822 RepID=UPI001ABC8846|nr:putative Ig domain-containing protein [aff. Roholtiella sp. LEGE 12411]
MPGVLPGDYYAIVKSDIRNQIPESNESNNLSASLDQFNADAERLDLGTADTGSLAQGQAVYYKVDVAAGETLRVKFDSASTTAANELYIRYGDMPSRGNFDFGFSDVLAADQDILVPATRSGTYYILAYGASVGGTPADYTIEADVLDFEILDIGTKRGSNLGQTTITISGSKFSTDDVISLVANDGTGRTASRVWWKDSTELWATFDLQGLTTGLYDVKVENGTQTATLDDAFTVTNRAIGNLIVSVDAPSALRPGQGGIVTVNYANTGDTDIVAPLLTLVAENANLRLPEQTESVGSTLQFLGIDSEGPAGILAPGESGSFSLVFNPTVNDGSVSFSVSQASQDQTIDWDSLKNQARPNNISNDAWDAIWENFITSVGNEAGTYQEILADNANHLSQLGEYTNDAIRLLGFELLQVSNSLAGSKQDDSIDERFITGTFGRGGVNDWDIKVTPDTNGDVTLLFGTSPRLFTKQIDGSYQGQSGDNATLTQDGGVYRLQEDDGTLIAFRLDGKFDYIEDTNQNRVTANYTDGKLTRLVHSDGNYLAFSYNDQGLVTQTTDQDNWTTTYEYDITGEYLLGITTPEGTTNYTYETNSTSASQHAIKSVRFSDNTGLFYEYDNQGRLIKQSLDGNAEPITYSYDSSGGVTVTDASGAVSKLLYNDRGTLGRIEDPLKRITQYQYDSNGNLTKLTAADNTVSTFTYDNLGNIISSVNSLGQQIKYSYETNFNQLATVRDQRGNPLNYSYDNQGNLEQISYADGSKETFSYDATGNVTVGVNRRNQNISYTYNSEGLLTRKDFADGTSATYTYDSRGNLLSATDSDSSVTYTYDSVDRISKVSYGADRFLEFTYDSAGRRSQMVDQDGFTTNYNYDTLGKLKSLTDGTGANIITYTYDNVGRLSREDNGNGTYTTYSYDLVGQLLILANYESDGIVNSRFDYTYDNAGRRTSMTTLEGTTTYGYDSIGQLTLVNLHNGRIIEYQYDGAGNRIQVKDSGVETGYNTNNLNQYTSVGAATFTYDTDGNLITKTQGANTWTYSYDSENRLIGAVTPEGNWSYEYDALGNRIASILNGQRTEYLLDPTGLGDVVGEYGGNENIIARYTHGLGLVSRVDGTNAASYYDADAIGSIVGLTGGDGDYLNQYSYLPFGEDLTKVETVANPFEYVGQWGVIREGNGLDFMRARFYDPSTGKFTSPDPFGIGGGDTNFYRYSINNPNSYIDASGNFFFVPFLIAAAIGAGSGAVSGAVTDAAIQGVSIAAGVQDKFDWGSVGESAAWGAAFGAVSGGLAGGVGRGLVKEAGQEWSHAIARKYGAELSRSGKTINDQKKWFIPEALVDEKKSQLGKVMGNFRSPQRHALNDPDRHHFFPKPWKDNNPLNNKWKRFIDRVPDWVKDGFAAGGFGGIIGSAFSRIIRAIDPNDIIGPAGFGEEKWITASSTLPYTIRFENQATATAPAQQVVITQQLDPDLDFRTYRVGDFGWGDLFFDVPDNRAFYNDRLDLTATKGYYVDVSAGIDITTGEAFWTITTIDPETGEIPEDALAGFLPPNNEDGAGDGFVNYSIRTRRDVQTGAVIDAEARIVFNTEEPIDTPPIFNTIDAGTPSSTINALPATTETAEFLVNWSGSDDTNGSALANYTIYVSDNGSPFTPWLENTTLTEASYIGEPGHTYAFYSVARDNAGNSQAVPSTAQATIQILGANVPPVLALNQGLTLNEQATGAIANTQLQVTDVDNSTTQVTYTLTDIPDNGTLLRNNLALAINDTFTQADIDINLLNYTHNGSETTNDSFSFTVADGAGGAVSNTTFNITVNPVNDTPILGVAIADQTATEDTAFTFAIPENTFSDSDAGDSLTYTATLQNGDALPTWLTFDAATRTFSGTPANNDVAALSIKVTATDNSASNVDDIFTITVANTNDAPILGVAIADVRATQDTAFNLTIPANTFNDIDVGDTLTYTATLENGNVLPTWLTFNPTTRTFSGTPTNANAGTLNITIRAADSSNASISDTFALNITNLINNIVGTAANNTLTGTPNNDNIQGLGGNDTLFGLAGNDILDGGTGNDSLDGGVGNDTMIGGVGNDIYYVDSSSDQITELANEGTDTVRTSVTWILGDNLENLILTGTDAINGTGNNLKNSITGNIADNNLFGGDENDTLKGNAGNDTLDGGAGNDSLDGGVGNDTMIGGVGNDTYYVDNSSDQITELANEGTDTVRTSVTWILGDNLENLILTGTDAINGTGNNLKNSITGNVADNNLFGGDENDTLKGNAGNDTLDGGAGNDSLDGGVGNDTMIGGVGNDTYYVDNSSDQITELANEGTDTVRASVSWTLGDNLENLILIGSDAINGSGNALKNTITGNSANNNLFGGDDNDNLNGGTGDDTLDGGNGNDTLTGGAGNDILVGGTGSDRLTGGTGNDRFVFASLGEGVDTINDFSSTDDVLVVQNLLTSLNYTGANPIGDGYIRGIKSGSNTLMQIDTDGVDVSANFSTLVTLNNFNANNFSQNNLIF